MTDPVDPIAPPPASAPGAGGAHSGTTGLPSNVAAALACIPLIGGIIFYVLEKHDRFVRFYAMQSIILGGAWMVFVIVWNLLYFMLAHIPALGWIFGILLWLIWTVVNIAVVIVWIIAMIKAFSGAMWDIPYIGPVARKQENGASAV